MRILIAEDDPYSLLILRLMLEKESGWTVDTTENGQEAWERLADRPVFDVCVLDVMMPVMSGLELAEKMRTDPRFEDQPIIFCTALNDRSTVKQAAALSASHYITKPYTREHVVRQVRRAAASRATCSRIEPTTQVASRLGLATDDIARMQLQLQQEIARLVGEGDASSGPARAQPWTLRVNALKGAAANLGARRLAEELGGLEACPSGDATRSSSDWDRAVKRVAAENEHLLRCLGRNAAIQTQDMQRH